MIIKCRERSLEIGKRTLIMGILNITPDSFSDGGKNKTIDQALENARQMVEDGADIIDIGGESTRPGYIQVPIEEEINRVVPIIKAIKEEFDITLSIDTYKYQVAKTALDAGVHIINDIWGLQYDQGRMAEIVSEFKVPIIAMHNQTGKEYKKDIILTIKKFFNDTYNIADKYNIDKNSIILDPGIGFGKGYEENIEVLHRLQELRPIGRLLLGTSRKRFLGKILNEDIPDKRDIGTAATTVIGISKGVDIVRVHNVKINKEAALVADSIYR